MLEDNVLRVRYVEEKMYVLFGKFVFSERQIFPDRKPNM